MSWGLCIFDVLLQAIIVGYVIDSDHVLDCNVVDTFGVLTVHLKSGKVPF